MKKFICGLLVGCGLSSACFGVFIGSSGGAEKNQPRAPEHGSYIYVYKTKQIPRITKPKKPKKKFIRLR